jgi:Phytanoyl-CoA dioxygenase (PhyH)
VDVDAVRDAFADRGVVRLDGAFGRESAAHLREVVRRYAERRTGVMLDGSSPWPEGRIPLSWKGLKRNPAFGVLLDNPAVRGALDAIFGAAGWQRPKPGAQVLVTLPMPGPWSLPDGWHMDCGFERPTWPVFAVKVFAFLGDVGPCGGGTMLLPGSHRLVDRYRWASRNRRGAARPTGIRSCAATRPSATCCGAPRGPTAGGPWSAIGTRSTACRSTWSSSPERRATW